MAQLLHPYLYQETTDGESGNSAAPVSRPFNPRKFFQATTTRSHHEVPGLEDAVRQLFHMTLASLRGYREIAHLATDSDLLTCVDVLVHQRSAQCRALAQMSHSLYAQLERMGHEDELQADPSAADLQLVWLRTIWSFEQEEFGRYADNIEQAEAILEDAFLSAANAFRNTGVAAIFRQFAMNICGARQRWEELSNALVVYQ